MKHRKADERYGCYEKAVATFVDSEDGCYLCGSAGWIDNCVSCSCRVKITVVDEPTVLGNKQCLEKIII
ncbi:MAG: hypothetical protein ACE5HX_15700 [bacterium]